MIATDRVVIPLNKGRMWIWSIICVLFIVLGFFFVLTPYDLRSPLIHNLLAIRVLGFIALILFGYFLGAYIPKLRDKLPGLIIDENGVNDNSTEVSIGEISWDSVMAVYRQSVAPNKFMIIKVKDPEAYIARTSGRMQKNALKGNLKIYGSPIAIPSNTLKCRFKELESLLTNAFEQYKEEHKI